MRTGSSRRNLAAFGAFVLALALFLVPRYATAGTVYFSTPHEHSGVGIHVAFQLVNEALWGDGAPLWNPWSGCGTPHLANLQSASLFPLHVLFLVLPPIPAAESVLVLRLLLAGGLAFAFGRALGLSRVAALLVAAAYALNAWELRFANNAYGNGVMLLPATSLAFLRLGQTGGARPLAAAIALTGLHVLAGLPESAAFSLAFAALLYAFTAWNRARAPWGGAGRKLAVLVAALGGGALLAAAQVLPFLELLGQSWSTHLGNVDFSSRSTPPVTAFAVAYPFLDPTASILTTSLSPGVVVLCFALRGLVRPLGGGLNLLLGGFVLLGALKLFGVPPLHSLGHLPFVEMLDFPLYLPPALHLSLAVLAGMGLDEWGRAPRTARGTWLAAGAILIVAWIAAPRASAADAYAWALFGVTVLTVALGLAGRPQWAALAPALLVGELWLHYARIPDDTRMHTQVYEQPMREHGGRLGAFLGEWLGDEWRFRVAGSTLPNIGMFWGPARGFDYKDAILVERFQEYMISAQSVWGFDDAESSDQETRLLDLAAVRAVVVRGEPEKRVHAGMMHWLQERGLRSWEGGGEPAFEDARGRPGEVAVLSELPFEARTRTFRMDAFERVDLFLGAEEGTAGPVRFELAALTRQGELTLLEHTVPAGDSTWHDVRAPMPEGVVRGSLVLRASAPEGGAGRAGFGGLRTVRTARLAGENLRPVYSAEPYTVFENVAALPRAYVVHEALVAGREEVVDVLESDAFVPGRTVVLEQPAPLALTGAGEPTQARIVASRPRRVAVEVDGTRDGLLVLSDTFYPGWKARVDGEQREILPANLLFRAVPVERGRHTVEFTYDPWSFRAGAALSLATLLGLIALGARGSAGRSRGDRRP